jgi:hypothetical protein
MCLRIGSAIEVDAAPGVALKPRSRAIVVRVSSLFALDSLAGGFHHRDAVMAVVEPSERTMVSGITTLVRLAAWAIAPGFAGLVMTGDAMFLPLVIAAAMKIGYDLLLWRAFRGTKPPEERV